MPGNAPLRGICGGLWALLFLGWLSDCQPAAAAEQVASKEYQIKAAFLYNFTKFVEWPIEKFPGTNSPIVIGVLGGDSFASALAETIKGRKVNGREIWLQQVNTVSEVKGLHVLFVAGSDSKRFGDLEETIKESSVLAVGESEEFFKLGGAIVFVLEENKVRFEIDMNSAERSKLKISAQLQRLARTVKRKL